MYHYDRSFEDKNAERYMLPRRILRLARTLREEYVVAGETDTGDFDYAMNTFTSSALSSTYDALALEKRQQAAQLVIAPKLESDGDALFTGLKGSIYSRNYGERLPYWGGSWTTNSGAGLACLVLNPRRLTASINLGLRPAFIL
jgi:hypothetical protein